MKQYVRSRPAPSLDSVRRAKELQPPPLHPMFSEWGRRGEGRGRGGEGEEREWGGGGGGRGGGEGSGEDGREVKEEIYDAKSRF